MSKKIIGICGGPQCCHCNASLWKAAKECENSEVVFEEAQCLGLCEDGPNIRVDENGERKKYSHQTAESIQEKCQ